MPVSALDALIRLLNLIPEWPAVSHPMGTFVLMGIATIIIKFRGRKNK